MKRNLVLLILSGLIIISASIQAQTIYVDVKNGDDTNKGTKELPLKSLFKAAEIANANTEISSTTIKLAPGFYILTDKVVFDNNKYNKNERLVIEAEILPDNPAWSPYSMPVITSIANNSINFGFESCLGLYVEVNHVTIRGLKFTGNSNPDVFFYYPIGRSNMELKDFVLSQCLFVGDRDASPIQSGVLIHGDEINVDHCIFNNCKNTVVYYFPSMDFSQSRYNSSMSYCIINNAYETAIWTAAPDENFKFHHNIVMNSKNVWIHNEANKTEYKLSDCIFYNNKHVYTVYGKAGEVESENNFIEENVKNISVDLVLKKDIMMTPYMEYDYLHAEQESEAAELKAGLFLKERRLSAYVKYNKILNENGFDMAFEQLNQMKSDKLFFFEEAKFNTAGYELLMSEEIDQAIKIFTLVTEKFPDSSNAYDSLAESYLKKGDVKVAIKHYKKSLELNPENENAINMINEIDNK
ncbi:tetratricopeptide repeat protein [Bacteroidota bacterium]